MIFIAPEADGSIRRLADGALTDGPIGTISRMGAPMSSNALSESVSKANEEFICMFLLMRRLRLSLGLLFLVP